MYESHTEPHEQVNQIATQSSSIMKVIHPLFQFNHFQLKTKTKIRNFLENYNPRQLMCAESLTSRR